MLLSMWRISEQLACEAISFEQLALKLNRFTLPFYPDGNTV
jgi:hypothetical protein